MSILISYSTDKIQHAVFSTSTNDKDKALSQLEFIMGKVSINDIIESDK